MPPFWLPSLWIGFTLWALPQAPLLTLLGYHALCLWGLRGGAVLPKAGRFSGTAWGALAAALAGLALLLRLSGPMPLAGAQTFLAAWPGGFFSYVAYTLTVNSLCEEGYWRHALPRQKPGWSGWQHGAAFGLHHAVANALVFGWVAAPLAFLYTALGGRVALWAARRTGGLLLPVLGHSLVNALTFAWMWRSLPH